MRKCLVIAGVLAPSLAWASGGPVPLGANNGAFGDWTAAADGPACYAFTDAKHSKPEIAGRGAVMLTVTEQPGVRDEVTLAAGYAYPANAKVRLVIGVKKIDFYTQAGNAFTTQGAEAVAALKAASFAKAVSTGPDGNDVVDLFALKGFSGAYAAITAACP